MLTKEPEMLQPSTDAFCEHTMQQNATGPPQGELTALPRALACFKGAASRWGWGEGRDGKGIEGREREKEDIGTEEALLYSVILVPCCLSTDSKIRDLD